MNTLVFAAIDVAFDSVHLALSVARFAVAAAVCVHEVGQATIQAGAATRQVVQAWVDDVVAKAEAAPVAIDAAIDAVAVTVFQPAPLVLAPVAVAGYLPSAVEKAPRKAAALKALVAESRCNYVELAAITADLVTDKEADLSDQYQAMGIRALRQLARSRKITRYSKLSKAALVELLAA